MEKEVVDTLVDVFTRIKDFFRDVVLLIVLNDLKGILKKHIKSYSKPYES
jgi:hypothetical protein